MDQIDSSDSDIDVNFCKCGVDVNVIDVNDCVCDECNEEKRDDCTDEKSDTVDVCEASPSADCDLGDDTTTGSSVLPPGAPLTAPG